VNEDRLIDWLRIELVRRGMPSLLGHDVAQLTLAGDWAVSADHQIEGTHFPPSLPANRIGRRLVGVNLSDLAAAGAEPNYAIATIAAPSEFDHKAFFMGLLDACQEFGLALAGGDLARSSKVHSTLTVFGRRQRRRRFLRRNLARTGDLLWLGGCVGESAIGRLLLARGATATAKTLRLPARDRLPHNLHAAARSSLSRHLAPEPQLALGTWLASRRRAAAIDVSDGVLLDLERLARESRVRCELDATSLPLSSGFQDLAHHLGVNPLTLALTGGEDYVLLFALPRRVRPPASYRTTPIGRVTAEVENRRDATVRLLGAELPAGQPKGWDHLV
jgi:thiamine-monophosphate kinase